MLDFFLKKKRAKAYFFRRNDVYFLLVQNAVHAGFDCPTILALQHCLLRCFISKQCLTQIGFDGDGIGSREEEMKSDINNERIRKECYTILLGFNKR